MIYFNNAATSWPKPDIVYQAADEFFRSSGINPGRSGTSGEQDAAQIIFETREKIADFFSISNSAQLVFNSGSTESLNTVIKGVLEKGDHVITSKLEHNSVLRPLERLKTEKEITVDYIEFNPKTAEIEYQSLKNAVKNNTKLIIISHASNVLGTVNNLQRIGEIAAAEDILFLVDAAQTAGVIPIDVDKMKIDFLAVPGHKSLFGPPGIGALYVRDHELIRPLKEGGTGTNSLSVQQPKIMPDYLEAGTLNTPGIIGLGAGIEFIQTEGLKLIHQQEMRLLKKLINGLKILPEIKIYGKKDIDNRTAVTAFNLAALSSNQLAFKLQHEYNIQLRGGLHCAPLLHKFLGTDNQGMLRLSPGYFNTEAEVDEFLNILETII
ncbi:MAG: cysteine desulfurase [Halanaerobium sp. 4-GBenrich]|jgi:cysteine desulfurase family protein|uniref:cysteine desulfurase n=1 Tax=Halanaerobium congolense TaxID=54121 RepID=A0A1M7I8H2_9FIRM|nr:aminotransferase class V-fold PLP-dependent enzyme [Halanaerobium congolense]KXS47346.1 MAG: cysteine desulfurase [Halanaerobium sp. T82-1]ODS50421.1 MAG: cysteine desulfurase [Halanaerobium sp. 4-GBenrich]PUU87119.1 MAG: cysteine desulfurase [Halanaerobium sp.]PTX16624.1 cysteine desulfurase family protein [Halanaerobium congolense]PXV67260.1 cysteine desulfurase family protein [Halanaerobium congolense]